MPKGEIRRFAALSEGLNTRRLSEVEDRETDWLWDQRMPLGNLTIISGDPCIGKTWVTLDIMARITTGRGFPDGTPNPIAKKTKYTRRRDVLWLSAEDPDETIKHRFRMLNGDDTRFHSHTCVCEMVDKKGEQRRESTFDLGRHLDYLDDWLTNHPLAVLVALDPLQAFIGRVDSHRNSEVRSLLTPLSKLATKHAVAIIGINHLNKGEGGNAMYRGIGSIAFVAAARSSWLVSKDAKEPKDRRLFTEVKVNDRVKDVGGLAFRVGAPWHGFSWEEGRLDTTADEALLSLNPQAQQPPSRAPALTHAMTFLQGILQAGPMPAEEVRQLARKEGICSNATLSEARKRLGIEWKRKGGSRGEVLIFLPGKEEPIGEEGGLES